MCLVVSTALIPLLSASFRRSVGILRSHCVVYSSVRRVSSFRPAGRVIFRFTRSLIVSLDFLPDEPAPGARDDFKAQEPAGWLATRPRFSPVEPAPGALLPDGGPCDADLQAVESGRSSGQNSGDYRERSVVKSRRGRASRTVEESRAASRDAGRASRDGGDRNTNSGRKRTGSSRWSGQQEMNMQGGDGLQQECRGRTADRNRRWSQ